MTQLPTPGEPARPTAAPPPPKSHRIRRTRMGGAWTGLALAAVILVFLLIFILENGQQATVGYFGAHGHLPLGVALLLSAVAGALLVVIPGTGRILQLRATARRHRKLDTASQATARPSAAPATQNPAPAQPAPAQPAHPG
jgi:lipopolysaccharide assembly protein A